MGKYRALTAVVLTLLPMLVGCHHRPITIIAIGAPSGLAGTSGHVGDVITWTTQEPDGPGYTVTFKYGFPCKAPLLNSFHVDAGKTQVCTVVAPQGTKPGDILSFTYQIGVDGASSSIPAVNLPKEATKRAKNQYDIPFSIIPCRACATAYHVDKLAKLATPPDPTQISCSDNGKTILPVSTTIEKDASTAPFIYWQGTTAQGKQEPWTAYTFVPSNQAFPAICPGTYSGNTPSRCVIDLSAFPDSGQSNQYTYTTTLTGCGSSSNTGTGTLILHTP